MKTIKIDPNTNPCFRDLYLLLSEIFNQDRRNIVINRISSDIIYKKIQAGEFSEIDEDMKISKSTFHKAYLENKEIIVQITPQKIVIYVDT